MTNQEFDTLRPLLFSIAYRMLGSVSEAEDIVQESFLRYQRALSDGVAIESPKAYLSAISTRLSIDHLRSARNRRETYVGEWLPEPILTDVDDPSRITEEADSLSMAFLLLLERLSPVERAVFLLHDVFAFDYDEIGEIVHKSAINCRQLATRARRHIEAEKPRYETSKRERDELATRFFAAMTNGDLDGLVTMLAEDVVVYGDGGGKAPQWSKPIVGPQRVASLFAGLGRQLQSLAITVELRDVNAQPGAVLRTPAGELINVFALDIVDGVVQTVRSVINPDKLRHLGPVADVRALAREARRATPEE
ncbi:MAG TPA: RNA polymerase sigma-70 factor [Gaiellaceae bacterium]|nr:RNA polymerase sigma-70 factor [Gaiellaceae bacterium]